MLDARAMHIDGCIGNACLLCVDLFGIDRLWTLGAALINIGPINSVGCGPCGTALDSIGPNLLGPLTGGSPLVGIDLHYSCDLSRRGLNGRVLGCGRSCRNLL